MALQAQKHVGCTCSAAGTILTPDDSLSPEEGKRGFLHHTGTLPLVCTHEADVELDVGPYPFGCREGENEVTWLTE